MGKQPPQRSNLTVAPTSRRNGRHRHGARFEKGLLANGGALANGGTPTNGHNGWHADEAAEQSVVFVCSHCSESFARREDLLAHRAAKPQLEALADAAAAVLLSELRSSARARLGFAALFATCFALYAVGRTLQVPYLALVGELGVLFFGLGAAPLQLSRSARLAARLGVAGLVMLSAMGLLGGLMVLEPLGQPWHPFLWAAAALAAAALAHGVGVRRAVSDLRIVGRRAPRAVWSASHVPQGGGWAPLTATILGTAAWLAAAIMAGHITPGIAGFLPHIPPVWYAGVASLIVAVFLAHGKREVYVTLAVLSLVLALSVTPALVYAMPRSQSAAKHIEFVQLILAQHRLGTGSGIYATYSAFFAGIAWLCSVARVSDVTGLATWWPVFIGLIGLAELRLLFGRLSSSGYRCWAAIMIVVLVNSIGADYFSPQSIGFVMGLGIYALVLSRGGPPPVDGRLRIALLVFSGCVLATTHELSPFIVGGVLVVLALFGCARPRWAAVAVLVPAAIWAGVNFDVLSGFVSFSYLLHLSNFRPPRTVASPGLARQLVVTAGSAALLLGLLVLVAAALVGFLRHRRERWAWAFMLCAAVGLICVAVNPYGNEGIFRAALFGIPWLALIALRAFEHPLGRRRLVALAVLSFVLCGTFVVSTFGMDASNVMRRADLTALRTFERRSPLQGSYLLGLGYGSFPTTVPTLPATRRYVPLQAVAGPVALAEHPTAADLAALTGQYQTYAHTTSGAGGDDLYVLWSPAVQAYGYEYGLMSKRQSAAWRDLLIASPDWQVVYAAQGTLLFHLVHA